ncbi:hypothetical protein Bca4012_005484 [Brassica carinata]|uniref:MYST-type HAT domain-containing protein n=1 Tax=Brassica carinata TaxID=52824 RepID=A0A8X7UV92_BRACI|nr:hypothetical protein Bca52824_040159 [Brassica carinata]
MQRKCDLKHPPGDEIYQSSILSVFEIYGKVYAQNLCYLAKLFLDQQTLYYDVDLFMFYIMCECDDRGTTPHGWILFKGIQICLTSILIIILSWYRKRIQKKRTTRLVSILTLPPYQRKGYGKFLIALYEYSFHLTLKEGKVGTPGRPLSDLGLSDMAAIKALSTLQSLELIQYRKGQHVNCAGRGGLDVDVSKMMLTPFREQN